VHDDAPVGLAAEVVFDDERVFADAGIALIATLAGRRAGSRLWPGDDHQAIAKQCGTSVEMLERSCRNRCRRPPPFGTNRPQNGELRLPQAEADRKFCSTVAAPNEAAEEQRTGIPCKRRRSSAGRALHS
jgi:hypothetical protein